MKKPMGAVARRHELQNAVAIEAFSVVEASFPLVEAVRSEIAEQMRQRDLLIIAKALEGRPDPLHDRELSQLAAEVIRAEAKRLVPSHSGKRKISRDGVNCAFVELRARGFSRTRSLELIAERLTECGCDSTPTGVRINIDPAWLSADYSRKNSRWE